MSTADFVENLEAALRSYIDAERIRVETERDFLLDVLESRGSAAIEDPTVDFVTTYLNGYLSQYFPVEEA